MAKLLIIPLSDAAYDNLISNDNIDEVAPGIVKVPVDVHNLRGQVVEAGAPYEVSDAIEQDNDGVILPSDTDEDEEEEEEEP